MTENDRDVSARRVNINVIQAVSSHLDPSMCASPFILDNTITPVNKYRPALVIMRRTGGIFHRRRFFFFFFFFVRHGALALSRRSRGENSLRPHHFVRVAFQLTRLGTKAAYGCVSAPAWNIKSQMTSDNMLDVSWPVCVMIWDRYPL